MDRIRTSLFTWLVLIIGSLSAKTATIYHFTLNQQIDMGAYRLVKNAVNAAEAAHADYILITINTYGGSLDAADSIRTKLLSAKPVTVAWINNNAASAGALIAIACDSIYMSKGASIGAATVVDQNGDKVMDKYQSYMRAMMRSTAETNGRDPLIAEAMVDESIVVPGISDSTHILTFTTREALANNYCEGLANSKQQAVKQLNISDYKIEEHRVTTLDRIIGFLLNPIVNSILILMIFGGIYLELKAPGIGLPSLIALIGAVLYFAPLYLDGLAANWEILLFLAGLVLIALEIFVVPGFGVVGVLGIGCIIGGLTLSLISNDLFEFPGNVMDVIGMALFRVTVTLIVGLILAAAFGGSVFDFPVLNKMVLKSEQRSAEGYTIHQSALSDLIGKQGIAISDLRPSGKVEIDDNIYDAISDAEYLLKDTPVEVTRVVGYSIRVKKVKSA